MSKHKVKVHHWIDGYLTTMEHLFETLDEAIEFSHTTSAQTIKIYSPTGELIDGKNQEIHDINVSSGETYA